MGDVELHSELKEAIGLLRKSTEQNSAIISALLADNQALRKELRELKDRIAGPKRMENQIIRKYRRKRKDIIQHKIVELIQLRTYTLAELKEYIVDDMSYCSKATFYRYIEEIRRRGLIEVSKEMVSAAAVVR